MAIKKSQIYSTLWSACDALRGSMDASQYKDYVLILLFVKYLSDKGKDADSIFIIPEGCDFKDFVALKQTDGIGEAINKKLEAIKSANSQMLAKIALPNFNDPVKLGSGSQMKTTLSKLIGVFEDSSLDFSKNRSADDDILGDAYEYLMKNFAAQSGKSKGQFYTPAEVSRTMAKMLGLSEFTKPSTTIYDPTCGSASLLLRAMAETPNGATPYGQEKDNATASLAILNMLLHGVEISYIEQGDTINDPKFVSAGNLKTFDVCVANPPFSTKEWLGEAGEDDIYHRWNRNLCAPAKCGDYAFLQHFIASMKPETGRGACILPHGVLFRGNAEYDIRKDIVDSGYIEGIVGLPANVFFGTGIPACIIMLNKKDAATRKGIFFIDAKDGFIKDGAKNRLREQDVKRIVDTWNRRQDVPHYARFVAMEEIKGKNGYNLNIPRYVQGRDTEVKHDISAHLSGGLPKYDIDKMCDYWQACPTLRSELFSEIVGRDGYYSLRPEPSKVVETVENEKSFLSQKAHFEANIQKWVDFVESEMIGLKPGFNPKEEIVVWSQSLLDIMKGDNSLVNAYDVYQKFMEYWAETLQDDCYMVSHDGWMLTYSADKKNPTYEDYICDLLPFPIVLNALFAKELAIIEEMKTKSECFAFEMQRIVEKAIEELQDADDDEIKAVTANAKKTASYKNIDKKKKEIDKSIKDKKSELTEQIITTYCNFSTEDIAELVVTKKWLATIMGAINGIMSQITKDLTSEVLSLNERYKDTLSCITENISTKENEVMSHLKAMGFVL